MARPTKLTKPLQSKIVKLIKTGVSIADACSVVGIEDSTFYNWQQRGEAGEAEFLEFLEATTQARDAAKVKAIDTLHAALSPTIGKTKTVDVFRETRVNAYGREYEFKRTSERESITEYPADWRAAVEYLKRRFPKEWSEKVTLDVEIKIELVVETIKALEDAGIDATEFFQKAKSQAESRRAGS